MRKMKDSGVEWIGEIPDEWSVRRFKNFHKGLNTGEAIDKQYWSDNLFDKLFYTAGINPIRTSFNFPKEKLTTENDILLSRNGTPYVYYPPQGACYTDHVIRAKIKDGCCRKYLVYSLQQGVLCENANEVSIATWSASLWNLISLPVPPLSEQERIAEYLDKRCGAIEQLIANQEEQIEKLKSYKQSLITETVTRGLDPTVPMKDSMLDVYPYVPQHWNVQKTLSILKMPITDGPHTTPELFPEGIPFVSAEAVSCGNGSIDFEHIRGFISNDFYDECCKKYIPQKNDIFMIKSGATTGRVSVVDTDKIFTIWSPLAVFRTNPRLMYFRFLYYFLQSVVYQRQVQFGWTYGTQQNIGMRTLENLKVFVPPLSEQSRIAEYLDKRCGEIDKLVAIKEAKIERLREYKKSLIFEYVTGKRKVV